MSGTPAAGKMPRVSVITIFYNAERYLREALDSVLAQDFEDHELLLVDDGSTDGSTEIAREYAGKDPRIRYLEHAGHMNRGMSASRNLGLRHARGEFVAFIDADDRWRPGKLREQVQLLDALPQAGAVGGTVNYWASHEGGKDRLIATGHAQNRLIPPGEATVAMYPLGKADAPSMSDLMFRRQSILEVGAFEESFRGAYEDQAFLSKYYLSSTLYFSDKVWSDYRLHAASCMAQVQKEGSYGPTRRAFLLWFQSYVERSPHGADPRIRQALAAALGPQRDLRTRIADRLRTVRPAAAAVRGARKAYTLLRPAVAPGPIILMYHRIAEESFDPWQLAVPVATFEAQLDDIARTRLPLPLDEFAELHACGRLPRAAIAITFDDAYACGARAAAPLLRRFGIPATIFVSPELISRGREFWWDELERIVLEHPGDTLRIDGRLVPIGERQPQDRNWPHGSSPRTPRQQAYEELWKLLYARTPAEIERLVGELRGEAGLPDSPRDSHRPMTREEIRATASDLITFGSHALTHPSLPRLEPAEQRRQIMASVDACAELTGVRPKTFAYPYGDYSPELEPLVQEAGFVCACRADGWFVTRRSRRFALPRLFVGNMDERQLALRLGRP